MNEMKEWTGMQRERVGGCWSARHEAGCLCVSVCVSLSVLKLVFVVGLCEDDDVYHPNRPPRRGRDRRGRKGASFLSLPRSAASK